MSIANTEVELSIKMTTLSRLCVPLDCHQRLFLFQVYSKHRGCIEHQDHQPQRLSLPVVVSAFWAAIKERLCSLFVDIVDITHLSVRTNHLTGDICRLTEWRPLPPVELLCQNRCSLSQTAKTRVLVLL